VAAIPTEVIESVERFLAAAHRRVSIQAAYVYGSHAGGTASEWSDIDLAVVSADFLTSPFEERLALMRLAAQIDDRIEPHPFTPDSFRPEDPLVGEIRRTGVRIR